MNTNLFTNDDGLRLIETFEGKARLKARLCEGGRYELGYGVTFHLDGSPVLEGQTCTEDEAMAMFRNALQRFELAVMAHVTVPLNSNQFSALVAFAYNVGEDNFKSSTVLRMVNQLRFEDAAASFGMWVFATRDGYKQALRGLLRRRYAEACLFLSYDWVEACSDEAVALQRERPTSLPGVDRVLYKTPFSNILRVAQKYPLGPTEPVHAKVLVPASIALDTEKVAVAPLPDSALPNLSATIDGIPTQLPLPGEFVSEEGEQPAATVREPEAKGTELAQATQPTAQAPSPVSNSNPAASPAGSAGRPDPIAPSPPVVLPSPLPGPVPPKPPLPAPPSVQVNPTSDMGGTVKNMFRTKRFWGGALIVGGRIIIALDVTGTFAAPVRALIGDGILMDWMTGVIVTMIGEAVMARGEKTATAPMGTPKEVALYSIPPVKS